MSMPVTELGRYPVLFFPLSSSFLSPSRSWAGSCLYYWSRSFVMTLYILLKNLHRQSHSRTPPPDRSPRQPDPVRNKYVLINPIHPKVFPTSTDWTVSETRLWAVLARPLVAERPGQSVTSYLFTCQHCFYLLRDIKSYNKPFRSSPTSSPPRTSRSRSLCHPTRRRSSRAPARWSPGAPPTRTTEYVWDMNLLHVDSFSDWACRRLAGGILHQEIHQHHLLSLGQSGSLGACPYWI